jgi:hypothetical protein
MPTLPLNEICHHDFASPMALGLVDAAPESALTSSILMGPSKPWAPMGSDQKAPPLECSGPLQPPLTIPIDVQVMFSVGSSSTPLMANVQGTLSVSKFRCCRGPRRSPGRGPPHGRRRQHPHRLPLMRTHSPRVHCASSHFSTRCGFADGDQPRRRR